MTYNEAKVICDLEREKLDQAIDTISKDSLSYDDYIKKYKKYDIDSYRNDFLKARAIEIELMTNKNFTLESLDKIGNYIKLSSFIESCKCHGFIDYDGDGVLCVGEEQTDIVIYPSLVLQINFDNCNTKFDGVMWYNK